MGALGRDPAIRKSPASSGSCGAREAAHLLAPRSERQLLLVKIMMALINTDNSGTRAGKVIEHGLGDFEPYAQAL